MDSLPSAPNDEAGEMNMLPMSLAEAAAHDNIPGSTLKIGPMLAFRTRSPGSTRYSSDERTGRIHTAGSDEEDEIRNSERRYDTRSNSVAPMSADTLICGRLNSLATRGTNSFGMSIFSSDSDSSPSIKSEVSMTSVDEYPDTPMSKATGVSLGGGKSTVIKTKETKPEGAVKVKEGDAIKQPLKEDETSPCEEEFVKSEPIKRCKEELKSESPKQNECENMEYPANEVCNTQRRSKIQMADEERLRQIDELCDGMKRLERSKELWCRENPMTMDEPGSSTDSVIARTIQETGTYTPPEGHAIQWEKPRGKRKRATPSFQHEYGREPAKRRKQELRVENTCITPKGEWGGSWKAVGNPYFGNEVKVGQKPVHTSPAPEYPEVIDSQNKIIALLEMRLEAG